LQVISKKATQMKITKLFVVIATMIGISLMYVAMAKPKEEKPGARLDVLEAQVSDLQAELARVSPDADLSGTTYCLFGQGTWLSAGNNSASVTANPFGRRLDFTSSDVTNTRIYDPIGSIRFPSHTMVFEEDFGDPMGTYIVVGNLLTLTFSDNGESETISFIMTPDGQGFVGGFFERSGDDGVDIWETGMIIGVRAANCDGLT
jgi:hypothetical protein